MPEQEEPWPGDEQPLAEEEGSLPDEYESGPDSTYKEGNTLPDGSYAVGKNKPPVATQFKKGDGRTRGRRSKGTKNLGTDFREVMTASVSLSVNGKQTKVTRQRAIVMRLADNASRGNQTAIKTVLEYSERSGFALEEPGDENLTTLPGLKDMDPDEVRLLNQLLHKATGEEYVPMENPFAWCSDPEDPRNYGRELTVEGIDVEKCSVKGVPEKILGIRSRAYFSAALPRKPGCFRRTI